MSDNKKFWDSFAEQDFANSQKQLDQMESQAKQDILAELYQKSNFHKKPLLMSVLERNLNEGKDFNDFYQAWLPSEERTDKIETGGQEFLQHFPTPVRVINGVSLSDPQRVFSVGLTWVKNETEEKAMWEYIEKVTVKKVDANEERHEKIDEVADGKLLGLFRIESDDNLGTPF